MPVSTPITLTDHATLIGDYCDQPFHSGFTWDEP
jgi:hypothetical protein